MLPGAPRDVSVVTVTPRTVTLEWSSPLEKAELVQEYRVRFWISHSSHVMQVSLSVYIYIYIYIYVYI